MDSPRRRSCENWDWSSTLNPSRFWRNLEVLTSADAFDNHAKSWYDDAVFDLLPPAAMFRTANSGPARLWARSWRLAPAKGHDELCARLAYSEAAWVNGKLAHQGCSRATECQKVWS